TGINSPTTVNALKVVSPGSIAGTGTLTVNSGTVLVGSAAITVSTLAFGTREAIFRVSTSTTVDSSITGTGGLTVDSLGIVIGPVLTLRGNSPFTGGIQVHSQLNFTQDASLGAAANTINLT